MDYLKRLQRVQKSLDAYACDAFLVEDAINLYYLTGLELSAGFLLIQPDQAHLAVDNRYYEHCLKTSPFPVVLSDDLPLNKLLNEPAYQRIKTLGFDSETTSFQRFRELEQLIKTVPVEAPVKKLRMIKDAEELELLRHAARLGSEGCDYIRSILKEGVTETELAMEVEIFWKRKGSKGLAFDPIIAFGSNSSMPHYKSGNTKLMKGMPVLIDIGVNLKHYHSDMTRMAFFGEPDPKMREIYAVVKEAQTIALELCRAGAMIGSVDRAARDHIASRGYGQYFNHGLGHGVGLEIHEMPFLRNRPPYDVMPLQTGMVVTIEPGIYLPGVGGVRLEDSIVILDDGYEDLTQRPK